MTTTEHSGLTDLVVNGRMTAVCVTTPPRETEKCAATAAYRVTATCDLCGKRASNPACARCVADIRDVGVVHDGCEGWYNVSRIETLSVVTP